MDVSAPGQYAYVLGALWKAGDEFCIVEHDVVPWPGALDALKSCPHLWCAYWFPFAANAIRPALGCLRVSEDLIELYPDLWRKWAGAEWNDLDGAFYTAIQPLADRPHRHHPDVAHCKERGDAPGTYR